MDNRGKLSDNEMENATGGNIVIKEQKQELHAMSSMGPFCLCCGNTMKPVIGGYKCFNTVICREAGKLKKVDEVKWN